MKYRILAELTQLYEIEVDADNRDEALEIAQNANECEFSLFNNVPFDDDWRVIDNSVEEVLT